MSRTSQPNGERPLRDYSMYPRHSAQFVGVRGGVDGPLFVPLLSQKIGGQATLNAPTGSHHAR